MLIATVGAFGGALAIYGVKPWGPSAAIALVASWAVFLFVIALLQDRRDRLAGRIPDVAQRSSSRLARAVQGVFLLGGLACFGYANWLERHGITREVSQPWADGGLLLLPLGMFSGWAIDAVMSWVSRLRSRTSKPV